MDERRLAQIQAWLEEDCDNFEAEASSNDEEDLLEEPDHQTDSEQEEETPNQAFDTSSSSSENETSEQELDGYYTSVDNTRWYKRAPSNRGRTRSHNILFIPPGPKGLARQKIAVEDCLSLFLDDIIIDLIVKYTNIKIEHVKAKYGRERDAKLTDSIEMKGFFGILYMAGALKLGRTSCEKIFDHKNHTGVEAIYLTLSMQRFKFLLRNLRFDDIRSRPDRTPIDKLAPIREIFEKIIAKFQEYFTPSAELTLDEQLLAFRGRCQFRQYIPSKPSKYGIKVFALVDVHYPYTYNLEVYAGQQPVGPFRLSNERADVVMRLLQPIFGKNRNVTMDNWFSSLQVAKQLFDNKTTMVGTVRKDKREVPLEFRMARGSPMYSTKFAFHTPCTLLSYVAKPTKVVIVMSTMHNDAKIDHDTGYLNKPEIITYYNRTKNGVDLVDKMCSLYDVSRNSRRWPLTVFFDLLNLSALNALCIYTSNKNYEKVSRNDILISLALAWMKPLAQQRIQKKSLPRSLAVKIKIFLDLPENESRPSTSSSSNTGRVGRCHDCGRARNKSTRRSCTACNKFVCPDHSKYICSSCITDND